MAEETIVSPAPLSYQHGSDVSSDFLNIISEHLENGNPEAVDHMIQPLHAADQAYVLFMLVPDERKALVEIMRPYFDPEILSHLESDVAEEVLEYLGRDAAAKAISELDHDEAIWVLEDIEEEDKQDILEAVPQDVRERLEEGLAYPDSSAGRIMRPKAVVVPEDWTVGETIDYLREQENQLPDEFYSVFVVDPQGHIIGDVLLSQIIRSNRGTSLQELMNVGIHLIPVTMDQEEVGLLFRKYGMASAPVVDEEGHVLGMISVDDVVDIIEEEADEDMLRLGGITEQDFYSAATETVRRRFPWLFVNLMTAVASATIISLFSGSIQQLVVLAALMPIVASMGGNAGTQAMTVTVRALAFKELTNVNAWRVVGKEMLVGMINGLLLAMLAGIAVYVWQGNIMIAGAFACAIVLNLTWAGLAGSFIPYTLSRLKVDPAVSSSVFLTMTTDAIGFLAFLALATWMLL